MSADTLNVLLKQIGSQGLSLNLGPKIFNLKQGAIYGWWKVKNHLHTDR